jgi:hypothetical protein
LPPAFSTSSPAVAQKCGAARRCLSGEIDFDVRSRVPSRRQRSATVLGRIVSPLALPLLWSVVASVRGGPAPIFVETVGEIGFNAQPSPEPPLIRWSYQKR